MRYALFPESHEAHEASMRALYRPMPYPVPEVSSRDTADWNGRIIPSPVVALGEFARENSWEVITQYSCGMMPHRTTGKPGAKRHLIGLRFGGHPLTRNQAYAVYSSPVARISWTWDSIWVFGPELPPFGQCGITELKDYLGRVAFAPEPEMRPWIVNIREKREDMVGAQAERYLRRREMLRRARSGESLARLAVEFDTTAEKIAGMMLRKPGGEGL